MLYEVITQRRPAHGPLRNLRRRRGGPHAAGPGRAQAHRGDAPQQGEHAGDHPVRKALRGRQGERAPERRGRLPRNNFV